MKTKRLVAILVVMALMFTFVATAVACNKTHECGHKCTVEGCGKCLDKDCDDPVCADKCEVHESAPHVCGHKCQEPDCGKCKDKACTDTVCQSKCPGHRGEGGDDKCGNADCTCENCPGDGCECDQSVIPGEGVFTITLDPGIGNLSVDDPTSMTTLNGKIVGTLPIPTGPDADHEFLDWFDEPTGGNRIIEAKTVFTEDTTIYAQYGDGSPITAQDGLYVNGEFKALLMENTATDKSDGRRCEYWLGGSSIRFVKNDIVSIIWNGEPLAIWIADNSAGVDKTPSTQVTQVKVTTTGDFAIYLKDYGTASSPNWVCQFAGPADTTQGDKLPTDCDPIVVKIGKLDPITFYLRDSKGVGVKSGSFGSYCIYTFNSEIFGNWASSTTKGLVKSEITVAGSSVPGGWIFRWGSGFDTQTADINNTIREGGIYEIKLPAANKGEAQITEIVL